MRTVVILMLALLSMSLPQCGGKAASNSGASVAKQANADQGEVAHVGLGWDDAAGD